MTLMLHAGANPIDYDGLKALPPPLTTETHVPTPHFQVVDMVKYALGFYRHEIVQEDYGVTPDGARFFGVLSLRSSHGDYTDMVGLRSSVDKKFPIGISFGSRVFVCDNLAFSGDHVIKRKHTPNAKRDLPGLIAEVIEPLHNARIAQQVKYNTYRATAMNDNLADQTIMQLYRKGVINVQRIPDIIEQWETPAHDWGDKTCWRMFNAATYALKGKVAEAPHLTSDLHKVIDGVCEVIH